MSIRPLLSSDAGCQGLARSRSCRQTGGRQRKVPDGRKGGRLRRRDSEAQTRLAPSICIVLLAIAVALGGPRVDSVIFRSDIPDRVPHNPFRRARREASGPDIDSLIVANMATGRIPGLAACVVKGDGIVWTGAYGWARLEDSVPCVDTTVFDLASVSKTATSVALMDLRERGLFALDDDVNDYLPFPVRHPCYPDSAITVRMLLTHTSGIADNWEVFNRLLRQGDPDVPLRRFVEGYLVPGGEFFDSARNFQPWPPGAGHGYCNLAIALAGYLVEATGDSFHHYTRDSVFLPLGMNRTVWYFADIDTNTMAMPYRWSGDGHLRYGHQSLPDVPAGTMKSSTLQLARLLVMMRDWGVWNGVRVLDSTTVAEMTTVQHSSGFGLVWYRSRVGDREVWGHGGAWNGISTRIGFCRAESSAVVILCNMGGVGGIVEGTLFPALFEHASGSGLAEGRAPDPGSAGSMRPTIVRSTLIVPAGGTESGRYPAVLLDASGQRVAGLASGANDVRFLSPGIYFVKPRATARQSDRGLVRRIVVTK